MQKEVVIKRAPRYWFYVGLALFVVSALGSGLGTFDTNYWGDSLYGLVDWFAACIPYFFYGGLVGLGIDFTIHTKRRTTFKVPLWAYYTVGLIVISAVTLALHLVSFAQSDIFLYLYFPFYYAIFFSGYAYTAIPANPLSGTITLKLTLDIILLAIFSTWVHTRLKSADKTISHTPKKIEKYSLMIIFFVLTLGMILCATSLA